MTTALPTQAAPTGPTTADEPCRPRSRVSRVVTGTLLTLTALAAVAGAVAVVALHIAFLPVLSPSMAPTLNAGDLAITRPVPADEIQLGDAVVLPRPDAPGERYVHRVVELTRGPDGPVVRTKGDNNPTADPQLLRITSTSVPVVVGHVPDLGRLALTGRHNGPRIGLILLVGTCALLGTKRLLYPPRTSAR